MTRIKKMISLLLMATLLVSGFSGCTNSGEENSQGTTSSDSQKENGGDVGSKVNSSDNGEDYVLKWALTAQEAQRGETQDMIDLLAEKGIKVEAWTIPQHKDGEADKLLISLMGGEEIDICYDAYPNMKRKHSAGVIMPIEELANNVGYDLEGSFGQFLPKFNGTIYGVPAISDIWLTLYNKKIFDDAGMEYPSADNWTWEKYIETAEKLTDISKGIYGSYMVTEWNNYNYMLATQKGVPHYKEDGSSNHDDPAFAEALAFNYAFGNDYQVQPDFLTMNSKQLPYDSFTTGNYGMFVCGGWTTILMSDEEKYPRDWDFGILPMPYPEGYDKSTLSVTGNYWIPTTSQHVEEAFEAITIIAEDLYKLGYGRVPARVDLSQEKLDTYITEQLVVPFVEDGVTVDDIKNAWFDPERIVYPEKIVGPGDVAINQAFNEEGGLYGIGEKSLEEAMKSIKEKANRAINDDLNK
ncbi:type 2 periplasmic-binding domain-containing protein [Vallitalea okinawensis]|uniref:extracellular solute-binding protein n=1 Tax=Vallitalea okinawensis TaxID=2078660 RepID=UPI000CFAD1CD|nr:extracellular solute-binding protein [Vallitalea okinawensis]